MNAQELRPYPAYRDSGVEWLGEVPTHWISLPGRACYTEKQVPNSGLSESTVLSLSYGRLVVKPPHKLHGLVPASFETYQIVEPSDVVVRPTDLQNDWTSLRCAIAKTRGIITSAYICLRVKRTMRPEYGHLLLHTYDLKKVFYGLGSGLRQNLDWRDFKYLPCICPPWSEQDGIVRFLHHADRRIQRAIRAKEKLIALLEEQKQALIHDAVTGRTDVRTGQPYPAYKDSGVAWLGEIPEHWDVRRLGRLVVDFGGMTPSMDDRRFWDGSIPWVTPKDMKRHLIDRASVHVTGLALEETSLRMVPNPAVLMVVRGMILARRVPIGLTVCAVTINQDMKALLPLHGLRADFLARLLASAQTAFAALIEEAGHGTRRLPSERWRALLIPLPPEVEQKYIAEFLDFTMRKTLASQKNVQQTISDLKEYRTRLIADVVTGKLDVREAAASLPEEDAPTAGTEGHEGL